MIFDTLLGTLALGSAAAATLTPGNSQQVLGRFEADAGWVQLFDGETTAGWRGIGKDAFPARGWDVVDGCLHHKAGGGGGDIVTTRAYGDFELEFEWRVTPGANSGVKYLVRDQPGQGSAFGPEYQVLDDGGHANGQSDETSAGALYHVLAVKKEQPPHVDGFNHGRIVCRDGILEHWLNGSQLFRVDRDSEFWTERVEDSKFRGRADFATAGPGRIALQDHGDEVWFRNLRLRELPAPAESEAELYDGQSLELWREYGDADYSAEGDAILGKVGGGGQSFLISKDVYGDFVFETDVMTEEPGNSGIQIRSHELENARPFGYQIEIDPSKRAWSGGLFDEHRRGWLQDLASNPTGRAAYVHEEWNHFRIEANGPWIQVRVNGIRTADYFDTFDLEGFLALQVHSGHNTRVRWRSPRIWDLGVRSWENAALTTDGPREPWSWSGGAGAVLELPLQHLSEAARRYPVIKFDLMVTAGELHVLHQEQAPDASRPHECSASQEIASTVPGGWCVRTGASKSFKPGEWNGVSVGFDAQTCALQVNDRSERVTRKTPELNGSRVFFVVVGEGARVELRDPVLLGERQAR